MTNPFTFMRRRGVLGGLAYLTVMSTIASADDLAVQTRVRLILKRGTKPLIGSLVASDADALTVSSGKGEPRRVPLDEIIRLDVSQRRSRRGRGALIGLGAGALGGFIWGAASNPDGCQPSPSNPCWFGTEPWYSDTESGLMGAVLLGGLGALVGTAVAPGERWERLSDPRVRVSVAPLPHGGAVALTLRF